MVPECVLYGDRPLDGELIRVAYREAELQQWLRRVTLRFMSSYLQNVLLTLTQHCIDSRSGLSETERAAQAGDAYS